MFNALGDPTRRVIVERVSQGPISVSELAKPLKMTLAAVVQHIQILEAGGLVHTEKVGRTRTCTLRPAGFDLANKWITARKSLWEKRLDKLGALLDEET
ncbi:MAG: transcriptional regulator [Bdellovibrio sp.]|nr:MAG: transcriptional regulator [Bdellovibrio sp.]